MKKNLLLAIIVVLTFIGCQSKLCEITGQVADVDAATEAILMERINREWNALDSTSVENGKFNFSEQVDSVRIITLLLKKNEQLVAMTPVVLEKGKVNISVDSVFTKVSGTEQNDCLNSYQTRINEFSEQVEVEYKNFDAIRELPETEENKAKMTEISAKVEQIEQDQKAFTNEFVLSNINSLVGNYIFMNTYRNFSLAQKQQIIEKMNDATKADEVIASIVEKVAKEEKTTAGQVYLDFTMKTPKGEKIALSELIGKTDYLLVDFWASWCGPCLNSLPELKDFYAKNKGKHFDIVGVSLDKDKDSWTNAIKKYELVWNHMSDLKYWDSEAAQLYAINAIPATVLIDKNGIIAGRNLSLKEIQEILDK